MRLDFGQIEVVDDDVAAILRTKTPAEKMAMVEGFWRFARDQIRIHVRDRYPDWSNAEVQREVVRRISGGVVDPDTLQNRVTDT